MQRIPVLEEKIPNITVKNGDGITFLNDTVKQKIDNLDDTQYKEFVNGNLLLEVEEKGYVGKEKEIAHTSVWIKKTVEDSINDEFLLQRITPFDWQILAVCVWLQQHNIPYTTATTIFKSLGNKREPNPAMKQKIFDSIDKLRHLDIVIDATEAYNKLNRLQNKRPDAVFTFTGYLLPANYMTGMIKGKMIKDVIYFITESPLITYAIDKNQVIEIPKKMLEVPSITNTEIFIVLKTFIAARILILKKTRLKQKRQGKPEDKRFPTTIKIATLYRYCHLENKIKSDSRVKKRIAEFITKILEHLVDVGEITDFSFKDDSDKITKGFNKATKIHFTYK